MADLKTPADLKTLANGRKSPIAGIAFDRTGTILLSGGSGGYDVWNLRDGKRKSFASPAVKGQYGCCLEPAGRWAYISDQRGFRIQAVDGKAPDVPGSEYQRHVTSFDLSNNGDRLVMVRKSRVECWDVDGKGAFESAWSLCDGKPVAADEPFLWNEAKWWNNAVAISPDGKRVVTAEDRKNAGRNPLLTLRDGRTGKLTAEWGNAVMLFDIELAFAADGRTVFAWDTTTLERWDVKTGKRTQTIKSPGRAYFTGFAVHPTADYVLTVSGDGVVRGWSTAELAPCGQFPTKVKLKSLAISADGKIGAAGGAGGKTVVWSF